MFRKNTSLNSLQTRKKLLLAESELHRAELLREFDDFKGEISHLKKQAQTIGSIASASALAATAFSIFRRRSTAPKNSDGSGKASWLSTALAGARLGTSLFFKIKSLFRERE